jgi:hypothetical protein
MGYHKECYDCCKKVIHCVEDLHLVDMPPIYISILYCFYISAFYHKKEVCNTIIHHIYDVCEKNPALKNVFNSKKEFYESQFNLVK